MNVYGFIMNYYDLPLARNYVMNMQAGQEVPHAWFGFYQERGEMVAAVGSHYEYRNVLKCGWEWKCQPMPRRLPDYPEPWTLCGYTWLCHWHYDRIEIADTFAYDSRHLEIEMVANHSISNMALGTFDVLELRTFGASYGWYSVCRHWGFASKIGDNRYKI